MLLTVMPDYPAIKMNSAVCIMMASIGIALMQKIKANPESPNSYRWALGFAAAVLLFISIATLVQHNVTANLGIDDLFLKDWLTEIGKGVAPGRMTILTATSFVFLGAAFVVFLCRWKKKSSIIQALLLPVILIASAALISFLYGIPEGSKILFLSTMALHTAILLFILSVAG